MSHHGWALLKAGDARHEFSELFKEFTSGPDWILGAVPDTRFDGSETTILIDGPNDAFVEFVKSRGWRAHELEEPAEPNGG